MRLINKKTGEIGHLALNINPNRERYSVLFTKNNDTVYDNSVSADYGSLAELNEEWEDCEEEPKAYWFIDWTPEIGVYMTRDNDTDADKRLRKIGNYFKTKEEAEKAVEKLKAWQRLKNKGFEFRWVDKENGSIQYAFFLKYKQKINRFDYDDLDLLFGGEE